MHNTQNASTLLNEYQSSVLGNFFKSVNPVFFILPSAKEGKVKDESSCTPFILLLLQRKHVNGTSTMVQPSSYDI